MKRLAILCMGAVFFFGCSTVPFRETPLVPLGNREPQSILAQFQEGVPENFQLLNSVVFEYVGQKFLAIGSVEVDRKERIFRVAGFNPMGVKLFELSGDDNGITTQYAIEPLVKYGDIGTAVGNDIKRIYFDLVPEAGASIRISRDRVICRQATASGDLEYVFAGAAGDLITKSYYEDLKLIWKVSYYEYRNRAGKRYPQGIIIVNRKSGYQLTVREKEPTP